MEVSWRARREHQRAFTRSPAPGPTSKLLVRRCWCWWPCGFSKQRAEAEAALVQERSDAVGASRVVVLGGSAYFNRPGPRLVDSLELLIASR
jgi:hypothetical protein